MRSDDEAVRLMNDSPFGLTATIWTSDEAAAIAIGDQYVQCRAQLALCVTNTCLWVLWGRAGWRLERGS